MPELPEVELHRRHLARWLEGRVLDAWQPGPRLQFREPGDDRALAQAIPGARVRGVQRGGKHLWVEMHGGGALYAHLGMTGHFSRRSDSEAPVPRFHAWTLVVRGGGAVDFTDPRRFGGVGWFPRGMQTTGSPLDGLGPDLLDAPPTAAELVMLLSRRRGPLKVVLMDQAVVAGLGNIHAAEALWDARLDPCLPAHALDARGARALLKGIRRSFDRVLADDDGEGVAYVEVAGNPNPFRIYGREGEPCPRCRKPIRRFTQAGRSTFHCPACQRGDTPG